MGSGGAVNKRETCSSSCILFNLQVQTAIWQSKTDKAKRLPVETEKAGRAETKTNWFFFIALWFQKISVAWSGHNFDPFLRQNCRRVCFWRPTSQLEKTFSPRETAVFFVAICYAASSLLNCCRPTSWPSWWNSRARPPPMRTLHLCGWSSFRGLWPGASQRNNVRSSGLWGHS